MRPFEDRLEVVDLQLDGDVGLAGREDGVDGVAEALVDEREGDAPVDGAVGVEQLGADIDVTAVDAVGAGALDHPKEARGEGVVGEFGHGVAVAPIGTARGRR